MREKTVLFLQDALEGSNCMPKVFQHITKSNMTICPKYSAAEVDGLQAIQLYFNSSLSDLATSRHKLD